MKVPQRRQLNTETAFVPQAYSDVRPDANAFGAANAAALGNAAHGVREITNAAIAIKQQNDDMQLLDLSNKLNDFRTKILYDKENGYLLKQGANAAGKTNEVMQAFTDGATKILDEHKLYGTARKRAEALVGRMTSGLYENVSVHDFKQTAVRDKTILDNTFTSRNNILIQNRNNPTAAEAYFKDINTAVDMYANAQQIGEEAKNALLTSAQDVGIAQLLTAYAADENYDKLAEYFEKYSDRLSPENQAKFQHVITNIVKDKEARQQAEKLIALKEEDAYEKINAIENTADRNRLESEYKRLKAQENKFQSENYVNKILNSADSEEDAVAMANEIDDADIRDRVLQKVTYFYGRQRRFEEEKQKELRKDFYETLLKKQQNGEVISADDIPQGLDAETQLSMLNYINKNGEPDTDSEIWEYLYNMSVNNAQGFLKEDLNKYRGFLSDGEYHNFLKRQEEIKSGKYYTQIKDDDKIIDMAIEKAGLKRAFYTKGNKEDIAYTEIRALTREFEARKGRKITDEELFNIIKSLGYEENGVQLYRMIESGLNQRAGFIHDVINDFVAYKEEHGSLPDAEKYIIINKRLNSVIKKQNDSASQALSQPRRAQVGDMWNGHRITSTYGPRKSPKKGATTDHKGVDLAYNNNEIFVAFASGTVVSKGKSNDLGNYVDIKSPDGTVHRYGHANSILVKVGDEVSAGDKIGRAGSTGVSTGPHLHYAKLVNGEFVNPLDNKEKNMPSNNRIKIAIDKNGNKAKVEIDSNGKILRVIEEL